MENGMEVPQKIKNWITIWTSNSTSEHLSKENENTNLKRYMHPVFIAALLIIAKIQKQPKCPPVEWIKKMSYTHTHTHTKTDNGILLNHKQEWILGTSLVVQWLRIHLPMQGTQVRALVWEDPTCHGATKHMCHNYWAYALESESHNFWSPCA